jgi:hypothetical protein
MVGEQTLADILDFMVARGGIERKDSGMPVLARAGISA